MKIVRTKRASAATWNDLIDSAWEHYKENGRESIRDAVTEAVADAAIKRYQDKIINGFRRAGIEIAPDEPLTAQTLAGVVAERTGLELESLSPDAVMGAVDKLLAERLSQALGVPVTTVFDRDAMLASINAAVLEAIRSGRAAEFVNKTAMKAARRYMTFKRRGIGPEDAEKISARARQKKFRQTHRLVWD